MEQMLWRQGRAKAKAAYDRASVSWSQDRRDLSQASSLEKQLAPVPLGPWESVTFNTH